MKKDAILMAAFHLIADRGYEGTTMQQIAESVGVKKPTLYSYFESKMEIYKTLLQAQSEAFDRQIIQLAKKHTGECVETVLKEFFIKTILFFSERETLLFWKQVYQISASNQENECVECSVKMIKNIFMNAEDTLINNILCNLSGDFADQSKLLVFNYYVLIQGYTDYMMIFKEPKENIIRKAEMNWDLFWKERFKI